MSELRNGWEKAAFGQLFDFKGGSQPPKATFSDHLRPGYVRLLQIRDFESDAKAVFIKDHARWPKCTADDIMIGRYGASVGRILTGKAGAYNVALVRMIFQRELLDAFWVRLFLLSDNFQEPLKRISRSAQNGFNKSDLEAIEVPLAPLPEQRRIVAKIDRLYGNSKRAREQLDHLPRLVEKYKQAILVSAFRGELTRQWRETHSRIEHADQLTARTEEPLQSRGGREATTNVKAGIAALSVNDPGTAPPSGWSWVRLRRIARQETGHTPSRSRPDYWDGGIHWIGIRDAGNHHGQIINDTLQTISKEGLANSSARLLPAGTVCLSRTASVGYVTIMGRSMATSQDFATWSCSPALIPKYLMYALMAEGDNIREFGEGSTHTTIYFPEIRALHICLAPLFEQREIIRRVETALTWVDRIASEATSASRLIDHLDQAILAKGFRGALVPQDPNDEPASILLERVKAQRAAGESKRVNSRSTTA
jgi:type I restriction enzyme, S subunit